MTRQAIGERRPSLDFVSDRPMPAGATLVGRRTVDRTSGNLLCARVHARLQSVPHYFDESPDVASDAATVDVALPDVAFTMRTDRGVFSHGHVDTGTALLLREAPPPATTGDLLDLGCGSGALALALALRAPEATVWAVDTNERARHLTDENARRNRVDNIRVCAPSSVAQDVRFSTIWSNPPIRIGKPALRELLGGWLARLTGDGSAVLVVQKHLGADSLQRWLNDIGHETTRVASRTGFRLLDVRPREPGPSP